LGHLLAFSLGRDRDDELQGLDIPELVLEKVLVGNGRRLLGIA